MIKLARYIFSTRDNIYMPFAGKRYKDPNFEFQFKIILIIVFES